MKFLKIDWSKSNKPLSKKLNVFGSLFLFMSFTIQIFVYNSWDEKTKMFEQANRDFTEMTRTSLEYQNLYLGLQNQDSLTKQKFQPEFIKMAAEKYRLGKILSTNIDLLGNEIEVKKFVNNTNELLEQIINVNDIGTLYEFVQLSNNKIPENNKLKSEWMMSMDSKKRKASFFFLTFQILGSILLVLGYRYEE